MCIIAIAPAGVPLPTTDVVCNMWDNNPDGAGFMYAKDGRVCIEKGYMKLKRLLKRLAQLEAEIDTTAATVVLHFRVGTHGSNNAANTHPFPVTDNLKPLRALSCRTDLGVAHNGVIPIKIRKGEDISDTMEYIASELTPLRSLNPEFFKLDAGISLVERTNSKFVFLTPGGEFFTIGGFIHDGGMLYSNHTFESWEDLCMDSGWFKNVRNKSTKKDTKIWEKEGIEKYEEEECVSAVWLNPETEGVMLADGKLIDAYWCMMDDMGNIYDYDNATDQISLIHGARLAPITANYTRYEDDEADWWPMAAVDVETCDIPW